MDRRSGLKKAHFSSVPTRMSLFTCKKYVFLIEKIFPPPLPPKNRENSTQRLSTDRVGNSAQRFPMGRVGKLNTTLSYGSRCGVGTKFYRRFVVIPTDLY
ncbi:hypothetical protein LEP1GSC013_2946 [Leptospira interrogans serovar Valbuzzi str. Duyster]|nr:hypothetical protein LEP1GSC013_2946 [Leptospira interrogans serovar Valbuzzi str. Duyster]